MRNLKKFLALVLAMMMTLSLMVTVNAADSKFTDADKINDKFAEAVEVLESIGVFKGYESGEKFDFKPTDLITRAEVAAIVYRLATGDAKENQVHLYEAGSAKFVDVPDDHWAAGAIGYCANNLLVLGYDNTHFGPSDNVTGVQAVTMILRAVGYGQGGEFAGWGWETNAYGRARSEGLLKNVDKTNYASRLSQPATRELVAELLFQAALIPTVTWTQALGYNKGDNLLGTGKTNLSLGEKFYGLDSYEGIIVANEQTGEDYTLLGVSVNDLNEVTTKGSYAYTKANNTNVTLAFAAGTGIDQFGHKVKIWFDNRTYNDKETLAGPAVEFATEFDGVYTVMDNVTKTEVVSTSAKLSTDFELNTKTGGKDDDPLTIAAKDAGFTVPNLIQVSDNFYKMDVSKGTAATAADSKSMVSEGDTTVVLLISNTAADKDGKNKLDVAVALSVTAESITQVNAFVSPKTVTGDVTAGGVITSKNTVFGWDNAVRDNKVVVIGIADTTAADATTAGYGINKLSATKTGIVKAIDGDGVVTLDDGTTLEPSALYLAETTVTGNAVEADSVRGDPTDMLIGNTLTFTKDAYGKYVGYQPAAGFYMYATYGYYTQTDIDKITYYLQGVTMDGQIKVVEISETDYKTNVMDGTKLPIRFLKADTTDTNKGQLVVDQTNKSYSLCYVNTNGTLSVIGDAVSGDTIARNNNGNDIKALSKTLNEKSTDLATGDYLSKDTKYFEISGYGSSLKVTPYNSLSALMNGASSLTATGIYLTDKLDTEHTASANTGVKAVLIDSATRISTTTVLYSGPDDGQGDGLPSTGRTNEPTSVKGAQQFDMYTAGEDKTHAVLVAETTANTLPSVDENGFFTYSTDEKTGYVTLSKIAATSAGTPTVAYYGASSALVNAGTAAGWIKPGTDDAIYAADAKIIDLTKHGINSYELLRRAVEENNTTVEIKVDVLLTEAGGDTAAVVYVYSWAAP